MKDYLQECADLHTLYFIYGDIESFNKAVKILKEYLRPIFDIGLNDIQKERLKSYFGDNDVTNFTSILYEAFKRNRGSWESESQAVYRELSTWYH